MGVSTILFLAFAALTWNHGIALRCYVCSDFYNEVIETDVECRSGIEKLTAVECVRPETKPMDEYDPVCIKIVGALSGTVNDTAFNVSNVLRLCDWVDPGAPKDQCFAGEDGEPLREFSVGNSDLTEVIDFYEYCICSTDGCNGVAFLRPLIGLLGLALSVSFLGIGEAVDA